MGVGQLGGLLMVSTLLSYFWLDWYFDPYRKRSEHPIGPSPSLIAKLTFELGYDNPGHPLAVARAWDRHLAIYKLPPISKTEDILTIRVTDGSDWYWNYGYDNRGHLVLGYTALRAPGLSKDTDQKAQRAEGPV